MGTEKFCLRWNDFESNISVAFRELRDDKDFFDVTLACDDDQMQAHKVILSACSPFFRNILRKNPHQHPLLYLKGVKYTDLQAVLNFMYHGEVNVAQEELNSFLAVAEDLRVKGLTQNNQNSAASQSNSRKENSYSVPKSPPPKSAPRPNLSDSSQPPTKRPRPSVPSPSPNMNKDDHRQIQAFGEADDDDIQEVVPVKSEPRESSNVIAPAPQPSYPAPSHSQALVNPQMDDSMSNYDDSYDYGDYGADGDASYDGALVDPNMSGADGNKGPLFPTSEEDCLRKIGSQEFLCVECNKVFPRKDNAKRHVKLVHMPDEGRLFTCQICNKSYKNQIGLDSHQRNIHKVYKTGLGYVYMSGNDSFL